MWNPRGWTGLWNVLLNGVFLEKSVVGEWRKVNDHAVRVDVNERQVLERVISEQREKVIKISQSWRYKGSVWYKPHELDSKIWAAKLAISWVEGWKKKDLKKILGKCISENKKQYRGPLKLFCLAAGERSLKEV